MIVWYSDVVHLELLETHFSKCLPGEIVDEIGDTTTRGLTDAERLTFMAVLEIALQNLTEADAHNE